MYFYLSKCLNFFADYFANACRDAAFSCSHALSAPLWLHSTMQTLSHAVFNTQGLVLSTAQRRKCYWQHEQRITQVISLYHGD